MLFSSRLSLDLLPPQRQFSVVEHAGRRKRGKVAELLRKVKNLFLQIDGFAGGQARELHPAFRDLELAAQNGLAQPIPPALSDLETIWRHLLQQPGRDQALFAGAQAGHEGVQGSRIIRPQVAFQNAAEYLRIRRMGKYLAPILGEEKLPRFPVA